MSLKEKIMESFFYNTYFEPYEKFYIRVYYDKGDNRIARSSYRAHKVVETDDEVKVWAACSCSHGIHTESVREYGKDEIKAVQSGLKTFWKREDWERPTHL